MVSGVARVFLPSVDGHVPELRGKLFVAIDDKTGEQKRS
jgi:hypothetical protein